MAGAPRTLHLLYDLARASGPLLTSLSLELPRLLLRRPELPHDRRRQVEARERAQESVRHDLVDPHLGQRVDVSPDAREPAPAAQQRIEVLDLRLHADR